MTEQKALLDNAANEVAKNTHKITDNIDIFVKRVATKFLENKLYNFSKLCDETRKINILTRKQLADTGNEAGWSESRNFKLDYVIPKELYLFMTNMVYIDFWKKENEKVWRSFMKAIMRSDDATMLLRKVKMYFDGANNKIAFKA